MNTQYGGVLTVYIGARHQRGGGILSSIARFLMPAATRMLRETVRAAPGVVDNILNKKQSARSAILQGLKTAGKNTVHDTLHRLSKNKKRRTSGMKHTRASKRRKTAKKDIFS